MMKYELRFDDWAIEHRPHYVGFKPEDKDGVEVVPYDWDEDGNIVAVKYHKFCVRIAMRYFLQPSKDSKAVKRHTQLWEVHEQYKRRIW